IRPARTESRPVAASSPAETEAENRAELDWKNGLWGKADWQQIPGEQPAATPRKSAILTETSADLAEATANLTEVAPATLLELDAAMLLEAETAKLPQAQDGHSLVTTEVTQILENTLASDPSRVDVKIKLLAIYYHQLPGSRAEFDSLLSKLVADSQMLTPAQRAYLDKLQRTLPNDEPAVTDFVAKVAI